MEFTFGNFFFRFFDSQNSKNILNGSIKIKVSFYSYKQQQENKCPLRCASLRGVEFFPNGKRGERAQRLGQLFSCLYLDVLLIFSFPYRLYVGGR